MPVIVRLPAPLRRKADGQYQIELEADSLRALLDEMEAAYPDITEQLLGEDSRLRCRLNIYVNREHIRLLQGLDTPLKDGDDVFIVPLIAGEDGRPP